MRRTSLITGIIIGVLIAVGARLRSGAAADQPNEAAVKAFMRGKLDSSKDVLEGLVTEDFELVANAADRMRVMSKRAEWNVVKTDLYAQYSAEFQRVTEQLARASREKKLDAAAFAWMQVTMSCVNCHQHARDTRVSDANNVVPNGSTIAGLPTEKKP